MLAGLCSGENPFLSLSQLPGVAWIPGLEAPPSTSVFRAPPSSRGFHGHAPPFRVPLSCLPSSGPWDRLRLKILDVITPARSLLPC